MTFPELVAQREAFTPDEWCSMTRPWSTNTSDASPYRGPYRGQTIAVGTKHGKQHQLEPAFRDVIGAVLMTPDGIDTDRFGTFAGEIARIGPALDAARTKARLAMTVAGLPYGLASEASYGPLPGGWFGHEELLLFCDERLGIEVLEGHRSLAIPGIAEQVGEVGELGAGLVGGLPDQALIVRPCGSDVCITKGITDIGALRSAVWTAVAQSPDGLAQVEPDLRAQHNPSRRLVLVRLAASLAHRLATGCPACTAPGFGRVDARPGLPCRICATPTPLVGNEIHGCAACEHRVDRPVRDVADPADCPSCNP
jgi:hypothetical protein